MHGLRLILRWLKIEPEVLRFGEAVRQSVQQHRKRWDKGMGYLERETFDAFPSCPPPSARSSAK
jgi:hypothetical protein